MKPSPNQAVLHQPLSSLPLSKLFKQSATANGFTSLQQILDIPVEDLKTMEWFTSEMLDQITRLMNEFHLGTK